MALAAGTRLGPYEIGGLLGAGGMGVVYRARDTRLGREVALKVLPPTDTDDPSARERLLREARAGAALGHQNICTVHDVGEDGGQVFIAMELVEGARLDTVLEAGRLSPDRVADVGRQIADALAHAHAAGIVHRDLKCANVIVGSGGGVKVLDFGIAVPATVVEDATRSHGSITPEIAGTLAYMAPEILRTGAPATPLSDIWSLGVILHELASGQLPFAGATPFDLTSSILRDSPRDLAADVPAPLAAVIGACLAKDPERRYRSMAEVRAALAVVAHGGPGGKRIRAGAPRRRWSLAALAAGVAVVAIGAAFYARGPARSSAAGGIERIAVLPFDNLSGDAAQDFFAAGMTDEITTSLARLGAVSVISRMSVLQFKGTHGPVSEIGRRLGVEAIVEGTVLRSGNRVRISVNLVDARTDRHLWAESFERDYGDVLQLQGDIARAVARQVRAELVPVASDVTSGTRRVSPAAYDQYLQGRYLVQQRNAESVARGLAILRRAAEADPDAAIIQAALADAYREHDTWVGAGVGASASAIRAAAARALALDETLPEAHLALALASYWYDWDWPAAAREYGRALELNRSLAAGHVGNALVLQTLGRDDEAIQAVGLAAALEPLSPSVLSDYGRILYRAGRYTEATRRFREALGIDAGYVPALYRLADVQWVVGDTKGFRGSVEQINGAGGRVPEQNQRLFRALARVLDGQPDGARTIARQIEEASLGERPGEYAFSLATLHVTLGDTDASLGWLEKGVDRRTIFPLQLRDPLLKAVSREPRFIALLRRLHMPG